MTRKEILALVPHRHGYVMVVIGDNHRWAKGFTAKEAYEKAGRPKQFVLWEAWPLAWIDDLGALHIDGEDMPGDKHAHPRDRLFVKMGAHLSHEL